MVNVVVTGGAGFLGARLARELLAAGSLDVVGGGAQPLSRLTVIDQAPVPPDLADLAADPRVTAIRGELAELLDPDAVGVLAGAGLIFHLAAAVSAECEADFDLGLRANLRGTEALLACGRGPRSGVWPCIGWSGLLRLAPACALVTLYGAPSGLAGPHTWLRRSRSRSMRTHGPHEKSRCPRTR